MLHLTLCAKASNNIGKRIGKRKGFTLLEVLIAMVIFATAVVSLLKNLNDQEHAYLSMSIKTVAHWVALNKMNETKMADQWPQTGVTQGDVKMRNHQWFWKQTVSGTVEENLRKVEIEVRYQREDELAATRFVGFIANKNIGNAANRVFN